MIKLFKQKKKDFLKKESKVLESIPRLNILKQIFTQIPILCELDSNTKFILCEWKTTTELAGNEFHLRLEVLW